MASGNALESKLDKEVSSLLKKSRLRGFHCKEKRLPSVPFGQDADHCHKDRNPYSF